MITAFSGLLMLAVLLGTMIAGWIVRGGRFQFGAIMNAGEVAAWQAKWIALPVAIAALWVGARLTRNIKRAPERFAGMRLARTGFSAAIVATLLVGTLIGVTVPERLRRRQWGFDAAEQARGYTLHRALLEYRNLHGTLPPQDDMVKELRTLADPDGSIAEALRFVDANGYQASSVLAAAATKNKTLPRGGAIRNASLTTTVDSPAVSFTNYELRLPGADKKLNTEDDLIVRDGLIMTVTGLREYETSLSKAP
ncbi:MAG TPA: hypothetical protein VIU65_08555 [Pyrinomonadaceae bacterium]